MVGNSFSFQRIARSPHWILINRSDSEPNWTIHHPTPDAELPSRPCPCPPILSDLATEIRWSGASAIWCGTRWGALMHPNRPSKQLLSESISEVGPKLMEEWIKYGNSSTKNQVNQCKCKCRSLKNLCTTQNLQQGDQLVCQHYINLNTQELGCQFWCQVKVGGRGQAQSA